MKKINYLITLISFVLLTFISNGQRADNFISDMNPFKKRYNNKEKTIKLKEIRFDKYFSYSTFDTLKNRIIIYGSFNDYFETVVKEYQVYIRYDKHEKRENNLFTKILKTYKDTLQLLSQNNDTISIDFISNFIFQMNAKFKKDNYDPITEMTNNYIRDLILSRKILIFDEFSKTFIKEIIKINVYKNMIYSKWWGEEFYLSNTKKLFFVHSDNSISIDYL